MYTTDFAELNYNFFQEEEMEREKKIETIL